MSLHGDLCFVPEFSTRKRENRGREGGGGSGVTAGSPPLPSLGTRAAPAQAELQSRARLGPLGLVAEAAEPGKAGRRD